MFLLRCPAYRAEHLSKDTNVFRTEPLEQLRGACIAIEAKTFLKQLEANAYIPLLGGGKVCDTVLQASIRNYLKKLE